MAKNHTAKNNHKPLRFLSNNGYANSFKSFSGEPSGTAMYNNIVWQL